jgi:predicted ATPase
VAEILGKNLRSGGCFVDLGTTGRNRSITQVVSAVLGLPAEADSIGLVRDHLANKELILLLDNCDCQIDAAADFAESIQLHCPLVRILATSREPLGVNGEKVCRLRGLETPDAAAWSKTAELLQYPSVQLFLERAMETAGESTATDAEVGAIAAICRELDGIPLAIEIAAMRVRALGLSGLIPISGDHLLSFTSARRTGPWRHRSLGAALEWSFRRLSERESFVLSRLSRLEDWFDLEKAVTAVAAGNMSVLEATACIANLGSKSLLERAEERVARFRLLNFVRSYASKQLSFPGGPDHGVWLAGRTTARLEEIPEQPSAALLVS